MLNPGSLRQTITIQKPVTLKQASGAEKLTYQDYLVLRAGIKYQSGSKNIDNKEIFNSINLVFTTFYRPITTDMLILWNSKKYRINFIAEIGYREGLEISVERINE